MFCIKVKVLQRGNNEASNMNEHDNYSNFAEMSFTAGNELESYGSQLELQKVSTYSVDTPTEKRIEHMLLLHSRY